MRKEEGREMMRAMECVVVEKAMMVVEMAVVVVVVEEAEIC